MSARQPASALAWPVRQAGPGDADAIQALMVAASIRGIWPTLAPTERDPLIARFSRRHLRELLSDPAQQVWVALDAEAGDIVGMIALQGDRTLRYLFVRPRWQGQGVARQLWAHARIQALAQRPGAQPFELHASLNAVPACEHLGFVAQGAAEARDGWRQQPMQALAA